MAPYFAKNDLLPAVISTVISVVVQRGLPKVAPKPLAVSLPTLLSLFCTDFLSDL